MRRRMFSPPESVGRDPDYRFSLANERTFLAWIRTALALTAGGLGVVQLLPDLGWEWGREVLGLGLVVLGTVVAATSLHRWYRNEVAMRTESPLPPSRLPMILAFGVALVALVAALLILGTVATDA
jgi:putative membrane protein